MIYSKEKPACKQFTVVNLYRGWLRIEYIIAL
nr:MAG TPA: hypothetical protein [Caudoviricetes sp.]